MSHEQAVGSASLCQGKWKRQQREVVSCSQRQQHHFPVADLLSALPSALGRGRNTAALCSAAMRALFSFSSIVLCICS